MYAIPETKNFLIGPNDECMLRSHPGHDVWHDYARGGQPLRHPTQTVLDQYSIHEQLLQAKQ
jgi:hypothetical protein